MEYPIVNNVRQLPTNPVRLSVLDRVAGNLYLLKGNLAMLEVGSLYGDSACILSKYGVLECVDQWNWTGAYEMFKARTRDLGVIAHRGDSVGILSSMPANTYDLIYVDGCHTYPTVDDDITQAKRLIKKGGIICGDDLEKVIDNKKDFIDAWLKKEIDFVDGYHPGVSVAINFNFHPLAVNVESGFWWVNL